MKVPSIGERAAPQFLSVLPGPLLVLGSAHELFLRNQQALDGATSVLAPFWIGAGLAAALGFALLRLSASSSWARILLWAYHAAGAVFLVYAFVRAAPWAGALNQSVLDRPASLIGVVFLWLALAGFLSRRDPVAAVPGLALFGVTLAVQLGWQWGSEITPRRTPQPHEAPRLQGRENLPNVYHLVLDGFQSEFFDLAWPQQEPLNGFVHFRQTRSFLGATALSMASTFLSRKPAPLIPSLEVAVTAEESAIQRLHSGGYLIVGYLPPEVYPRNLPAFDAIVWHELTLPKVEAAPLHRRLFRHLWLAALLPLGIVDDPETLKVLGFGATAENAVRNRRVSALTQPVTTLFSFGQYLDHEAALPASGRYTLVHLLVPHIPFVLDEACGYHRISQGTDGMAQHKCAARLIRRFLARLEELGRLDGSVVIIQSDHGSNIRFENGRTVSTPWIPTRGDHPALLLYKPPKARSPLRHVDGLVRLIDVVPTLFESLALPAHPSWEGRALQCVAGSNAGTNDGAICFPE